eukprot:COSAG05_NODE_748_length_7561_cov_2.742562_1_plen_117_part_00
MFPKLSPPPPAGCKLAPNGAWMQTIKSLEDCQAMCNSVPQCKSIDYRPGRSGVMMMCRLGDCQVGHGCSNDNDGDWVYSACETKEPEPEPKPKPKCQDHKAKEWFPIPISMFHEPE